MVNKNTGSAHADKLGSRRIKGFTLVELIIVMAIIVILAGITSLVTQSFVRSARLGAANDNAQLIFTGFQNILTQCEIKQDQSLFDIDHTKGDIEHVVVTFQIADLKVRDSLTVRCKYKSETSEVTDTWSNGSSDAVPGATGITKGDKYKDLVDAIWNIVDNSFSGSMRVYIDYDNFEVKSVIFQNWNSTTLTSNLISENNYIQYSDWYYGLNNRTEQSDLCGGKKLEDAANAPEKSFTCGVYPYQDVLVTT